MVGGRKAIVNEESGVTRDRNYGKSEWNGKEFSVIDTGGYVSNSSDIFEEEINKQVLLAMDEADVILFVCDVELGITDLDHSFARMLRKVNQTHLPRGKQGRPMENVFTIYTNSINWESEKKSFP